MLSQKVLSRLAEINSGGAGDEVNEESFHGTQTFVRLRSNLGGNSESSNYRTTPGAILSKRFDIKLS